MTHVHKNIVYTAHKLTDDLPWVASCSHPDIPNIEAETKKEALQAIKNKIDSL